jgi:DNA-binding transcriptional LysR family regulator
MLHSEPKLAAAERGLQLKFLKYQLIILIMPRPSLAQLETFWWIARLGSFHAAARQLNVSQPTVSLRIRELETTVGALLLSREGHQIDVTDNGEVLLRFTEEMLSVCKKMEAHFPALGGWRGVVRVGMPDSIAATCLPDLINRVGDVAPQLRLDVTVDLSNALNRKLRNLTLDVAILAEPDVGPPIKVTRIGKNPLGWLSAPGNAPPGKVRPGDLAHLRILTGPEHSQNFAVVTEWLEAAGVKPTRLSTCDNLILIARLIGEGIGIGVLPLAMVQAELASGSLVQLACLPELRNRTLHAAYHTQGSGAAIRAVETVARLAKDVMSSKVALMSS